MSFPPSRTPGAHSRHPRLSAVFPLACVCGASDWVLLRSLPPDDDGRRRAYGCACCGARIDTREVDAYPVMAPQPYYCRRIRTPDAPCPACGADRLSRCTHPAYDALVAHVHRCDRCGAVWHTAEVLTAGPRLPLPRTARRAARRHALGNGG